MFFNKKSDRGKEKSKKKGKGNEFIIVRTAIDGDIIAKSANIVTKNFSSVTGNISGRSVDIAGEVNGNIKAENKITLRESAIVQGKMISNLLEIRNGASGDFSVIMDNENKKTNIFKTKNSNQLGDKEYIKTRKNNIYSKQIANKKTTNQDEAEVESADLHQKSFWS